MGRNCQGVRAGSRISPQCSSATSADRSIYRLECRVFGMLILTVMNGGGGDGKTNCFHVFVLPTVVTVNKRIIAYVFAVPGVSIVLYYKPGICFCMWYVPGTVLLPFHSTHSVHLEMLQSTTPQLYHCGCCCCCCWPYIGHETHTNKTRTQTRRNKNKTRVQMYKVYARYIRVTN